MPGRAGILMHWGNEADDSEGCLLVNRNDSSNDTYTKCCKPDNSPKVDDYTKDGINFMGELMVEINRIEHIIKEKNPNIKNVPKKIIIDESKETNN